jgi:hypothetical protein
MRSAAPATIFGHILPLDLRRFPEKRALAADAAAEFCRMKIDFPLFATKPGQRIPLAGGSTGGKARRNFTADER